MHRYFLIPVIVFFGSIVLLQIYQQYIYTDWKWTIIGEKKEIIIPDNCNDNGEVKIIKHESDINEKRSFKDIQDLSNNKLIHAVYMLPCEVEDRKFDLNKNIEYSIKSVNKWFFRKSENQIINFDKTNNNFLDITFIRVNKTLDWFTKFNTNENNEKDASSKIENIILTNSHIFNNFNNKKFIVFFEGWEKRVSLTTEICGRSRLNGKVAIFYTNARSKKSKSCTDNHLYNAQNLNFGQNEETILHEILHTLGAPSNCGNNIDPNNSLHVNDNKNDILYKVSGSAYLDFNNDDYYKHNISNCPDLYLSKFLTKL